MITSKLPDVGTTIFTVMSRLAVEHQAVNLGQGFPDFDPDPALCERVTAAMAAGHNQYALMPGVPALRQAISDKIAARHGHRYHTETEITVTSGATQALMAAMLALVHPGDEVILLEPCYDAYAPAVRLAGGVPVGVPLAPPNLDGPLEAQLYRVDWARVESACSARTRLLLINFPHNPTGAVLDDGDLDALEQLLDRHPQLMVVSDEVYEHIVFDGHAHKSVADRPALAARSLLVSSFGKTFHTTGWKIGYCCAPEPIMREFRKVHQFMVFSVSTPMQVATADYLADPSSYLTLPAFYQAKRDRLVQGLAKTRLRALPCPATYFLLADYRMVSDLPELEFARWLTREKGVGVIPISAFHSQSDAPRSNLGLIRICFAKRDDTLDRALDRLQHV